MKNENQTINETIKRTQRYWYVDGFAEIGVGILLMLIILFNYAASRVSQQTLQIALFTVGMPALILLGGRAVSRIVVKLKEKYTYPRTGYVSYPRKTGSKRWSRALLAAILGAVVGAVTSLLSGKLPLIYQQAFVASVIALSYIYIGYTIGLARFYIFAMISLALFGIAVLIHAVEMDFFLLFFMGQGLAWIVSGLFALRAYLKSSQPPLEGES